MTADALLPPGTSLSWTVTGVAGFIGSHLAEALLGAGQRVVGVDDFSTGKRANLDDVTRRVGADAASRFTFIEGSVVDAGVCARACEGADVVLHQAALGSVPRSIADPVRSDRANVSGFLTMMTAAKDAGVKRFVYASSSSVYGDCEDDRKVEHSVGRLLSPYAVTKATDESYAGVFARLFPGFETVGLRYFNVFGPRQDPEGAYAAVVPRWIGRLLSGRPCVVFGDGLTSRDFCYVKNVVQANLRAATAPSAPGLSGGALNVAVGETTSLLDLYRMIAENLSRLRPGLATPPLAHEEFRKGDIRRSLADTGLARRLLGYEPTHTVTEGMRETAEWYHEAYGAK